jgi:hypothetical protein
MATYATTTALAIRMVGTNFDSATTDLAGACLDDAEAEINKQLSNQFDLASSYFQTSTSVPPMIRTLTLQLSEGYMYERMARGGKEAYSRADRFIKRVNDNLKMLADGSMQLLDTAGAQITPTKTKWQVAANTSDYAPTFNEDAPRRWKIDEQKLQDIADLRGNPAGDAGEID